MPDDNSTDAPTEVVAEPVARGKFVPPSMEELAALLPEFEFISLIGVGGMSAEPERARLSGKAAHTNEEGATGWGNVGGLPRNPRQEQERGA